MKSRYTKEENGACRAFRNVKSEGFSFRVRDRVYRPLLPPVDRNWIIKTRLANAQAVIRGYFSRKWYRQWRAQVCAE